jgi:HEPN domain-containing protein
MSANPAVEWVNKAEDNYASAVVLLRQRKHPVPDVICNQCQQCAEKYLKAFLVRHTASFPKTHDLTQLEDLVAMIDADVRLIHPYLAPLNPYGVDVRYPGLGSTAQEACEAVNAAKEIRRFMRLKLGLRP